MPIAYTNHIGHSSRDKHSGKSTTISSISDLSATEKHNNHDYTIDDVSRMQSDIDLDLKYFNSQYVMKDGELVKVEGHLDLEANVREIYLEQFSEAVAEYNQKQINAGHPERQIESYIDKISEDKQQEVAVEGLIQFGSFEDWEDKTLEEREKVVPLLLQCLKDTCDELKGTDKKFVIAGASVHLNEGTPHIHYVGVPVQSTPEAKNGLKKRVKKTAVFTKDSLGTGLQDNVRKKIEPELKKIFGWEFEEKQTGRNEDQEKRVYVNEKLKEQIKEKEVELEALEGKHNAIVKHVKNEAATAFQEANNRIAGEIVRSPETYAVAISYLTSCDDAEFKRITGEGQKLLSEAIESTNSLSIDELINTAINAGKGTLSKEERTKLWDEYRIRRDSLSVYFRATLIDITLAKEKVYDDLFNARTYLYDAEKMLRHSKGLFETLFAFTMIVIENKKIQKLQKELDNVKNQYKDCQHEYNIIKQSQRIAAEDLLHCAESAQNALKSMQRFLNLSDRILEPDFRKNNLHMPTEKKER